MKEIQENSIDISLTEIRYQGPTKERSYPQVCLGNANRIFCLVSHRVSSVPIFFLFFSLNSFFFPFFSYFFSLNSYFFLFFSDFKVKVKSGYGYVSQLYVRGMAFLHLIYHPVEAEYKGQMSSEGSYCGEGGGGIPFSILDLFPNAECSREV